jgi:hypothetical protein
LSSGKRPKIALLCNVEDKDKRDAEHKYITIYRETILNTAPAGAGGIHSRKFDYEKYKKYIGVLSDAEIAEMAGVTRKAVAYHRMKSQIPASNNLHRMKSPPYMGGWNKIEIPKEIISDIGKYPDYILAEKIGVCKTVIARIRRNLKIKSFAESTGNNGQFKKGGYPLRWKKN